MLSYNNKLRNNYMHEIQKDLLSLSRNMNLGEKSLREIGRIIGVEHPQQISHHLGQLEKKGFIILDKTKNKIINVNDNEKIERSFINIPIVGAANCGPASLLAIENIDSYLKVSASLIKRKPHLFSIKAVGNSMNKANIDGRNIESGDYVIVDRDENSPKHGDYVLCVINGAANIKRFFKKENSDIISLISESSEDYAPIDLHEDDLDEFLINGTVIHVVKKRKF